MVRVLTCLGAEHDPKLVLLAVALCIAGSWMAVRLLARARGADHFSLRLQWSLLAGITGGAAIWTTHFVAMLGFAPGVGTGFDPGLTAASAFVAVAVSMAGFALAALKTRFLPEIGGAVLGAGIVAMHYTGMAAFKVEASISWDPAYVVASIILAISFGILATHLAARKGSRFRYGGIAALVVAICALHFTGMAAIGIAPDGFTILPVETTSHMVIAIAVSILALLIVGPAFSSYLIDRRRHHDMQSRLKRLADAAREGILFTNGTNILDANASLKRLAGYRLPEVVNRPITDLIEGVLPEIGAGRPTLCQLIRSDGATVPVEVFANPTGRPDQQIFAVRDMREQLASEQRIHYLAHFDVLTGLQNRAALQDRLDSVVANPNMPAAVICIDLDRFKEINDIFGHATGDQALMEAAKLMESQLKSGEYLARVGGDEFFALQVTGGQPEHAMELAERLAAAIALPLVLEGHKIPIGASFGIALYPQDGTSRAELMGNADFAMYRAKKSVGRKICFFEQDMDEKVRDRRTLGLELRRAIEEGQLTLHYQAQTRISTSEILGYEALLRWQHPTRGNISPTDFIPIAEETGLIVPIGEWVLRQACKSAAKWPRDYRVAVNISPVQIAHCDLPTMVREILLETGLAPTRLELEITESTLINDMTRTLHILRQIKAMGITVAMDDFGTGYSSLSTLQAFPFDKIKIDRSFVDSLPANAQAVSIMRAILALGRSLAIPVLAEGIETAEHLRFLREEGCEEGQGFLLGRPNAPEAIPQLAVIAEARPPHLAGDEASAAEEPDPKRQPTATDRPGSQTDRAHPSRRPADRSSSRDVASARAR
ncbi:MAG: EAL domain-containing protein [Beijerinckiaceae bacterium]